MRLYAASDGSIKSKLAFVRQPDSRPFTKRNLAGRSFCLEVMPIPCPHFKITIVKRSQGQSAVAGAAYQSGERLFSEYDQKTKFYNKKKELVHAEIMLPSHAPPGYADRATLWNAVEAIENQWNSQLARRIVLAFSLGDKGGFRWVGEYDITADEMLSGIEPQRETKTQQAKDLICTLLAGGKRVFSEDIDKADLERGIPGRTVRDAKRELGDALKSKIVEGRKKVF